MEYAIMAKTVVINLTVVQQVDTDFVQKDKPKK